MKNLKYDAKTGKKIIVEITDEEDITVENEFTIEDKISALENSLLVIQNQIKSING